MSVLQFFMFVLYERYQENLEGVPRPIVKEVVALMLSLFAEIGVGISLKQVDGMAEPIVHLSPELSSAFLRDYERSQKKESGEIGLQAKEQDDGGK